MFGSDIEILGNIIVGFIVIVVGTSLMPSVADLVFASQYYNGNTSQPTNITGSSSTIIGLTTLFYALAIAAAAINIAMAGLRNVM